MYSVTSSSVVASLRFISRVSRNRVPTPDCTSDRNSNFTMCGRTFANLLMSTTVWKTSEVGQAMPDADEFDA